jgi:hypothetical protein
VKKVGSICGLRRCGGGRNFKLKCFPRLFRLPNLPTDQASFGLGRSALSQPACRLWRRRTPASPSRRMSGGNRGSGSCLFARCVAPPPVLRANGVGGSRSLRAVGTIARRRPSPSDQVMSVTTAAATTTTTTIWHLSCMYGKRLRGPAPRGAKSYVSGIQVSPGAAPGVGSFVGGSECLIPLLS